MAMRQKIIVEIIPPKNIYVGDADAPVTLTMYGDYESDACAKAHLVIKKLLEEMEGKFKLNYRHFPLTRIHQRAHKAAEAAVGAAQEGKFWEMHDIIFQNRRNLGIISLKTYAKEVGVTNKNFLTQLTDSLYGWTVREDQICGLDLGVRDVPSFFINGELYLGKATHDALEEAIEDALKKSGKTTPLKKRA